MALSRTPVAQFIIPIASARLSESLIYDLYHRMPGRTDNSFTRPLPYCSTSLAVLLRSAWNQMYCAYISGDLFRQHVHRVSYYSPPEPAVRRYIAYPRTEPVTGGFLRAAVAALNAQPAPVRQPPRLLGVLSRLPVRGRFFWAINAAMRAPPVPMRHPPRLPIPIKAEIPPKRHVWVCLLV